MSKAILIRTPSSNRRQPLLTRRYTTGKRRFSEVAGGTTAECAAICCCCPCSIVNFLVLAVYKLPAGLCRRAIRMNRKRRLIKNGLQPQRRRRCAVSCEEKEAQMQAVAKEDDNSPGAEESSEREAAELLEKEMWERFYGTGFWRSPSQRETTSTLNN